MICPTCGSENPENSPICAQCGVALVPASEAPMVPSAIQIRRTSQYTAVLTKLAVYIDGQRVGSLMSGAKEVYDVQPGSHTLFVKLDNFSSPKVEIDLDPGMTRRFVCSPRLLGIGVNIRPE